MFNSDLFTKLCDFYEVSCTDGMGLYIDYTKLTFEDGLRLLRTGRANDEKDSITGPHPLPPTPPYGIYKSRM